MSHPGNITQLQLVSQQRPTRRLRGNQLLEAEIRLIAARAVKQADPSPTRSAARRGLDKSTVSRHGTSGKNPLREALRYALLSERPTAYVVAMKKVSRMASLEGLPSETIRDRIKEAVDLLDEEQPAFNRAVRANDLKEMARISDRMADLHVEIAAAVHELNTRRVH